MDSGDRLIARHEPAYQEFVRLYGIARALRPTPVDRWNGELYATDAPVWGSVSPTTGAVRLSGRLVVPYLTGSTSHQHPVEQAEALATVLHESTHTGMDLKAPSEPNAIHSRHSLGLTEGVAEVRAMEDFQAFTWRAGYREVVLPSPQYEGVYAATDRLLDQAGGPFRSREQLTDELVAGPAATHFDRLAGGVVRNRLWDVVPYADDHQRAVRAALIRPMLHDAWPELRDHSAGIGERVAEEIRMKLNSTVDEVRRHYRTGERLPFSGESPARNRREDVPTQQQSAPRAQPDGTDLQRFLGGQAPAGGAVARRPVLGQGGRRVGSSGGPGRGMGFGRSAD